MKIFKIFSLFLLFFVFICPSQSFASCETAEEDDNIFAFSNNNYQENGSVDFSFSNEDDGANANDNKNDAKKKKDKKDKDDIKISAKFFINFGLNLATVLLIILLIYYPENKKQETIFSFILFNVVIFLLTFVLNDIKISMGAAFGLFAVFSMLRYRTAGISMKDMTYLFVFIAIGLVSAISLKYYDLAIINGIVFVFVFIMDGGVVFKREYSKLVIYEKISNVHPDNHQLMLKDLKDRTGLNIHRITIESLDYLKDAAGINIFYYKNKKKNSTNNSADISNENQ